MNYQEYLNTANHASQLVEKGKFKKAIALLEKLVGSDISDIDKSMMCLNIAVVYDKLDNVDEAVAWYDKGMKFEKPHNKYFVAERLAAYLAQKNFYSQSYTLYKNLLKFDSLTDNDRERIEQNISTLMNHLQ